MRAALLLLLPLLLAGQDVLPIYSEAGTWAGYTLLSISVENRGGAPIAVFGSAVWADAQRQGLRPLTNAQVAEIVARKQNWSARKIATTVGMISAGVMTTLQGFGSVGEKWADGYKSIAPGVGVALLAWDLGAGRHERDFQAPADYLPAKVDIPPGRHFFGVVVVLP